MLSGDKSQTLGLLNLAQRCGHLPPEDWPAAIRQHFEVLLVGTPRNAQFIDSLSESFDEARGYLKVRLQPSDYMAATGVIVSEPVADGLISVLVYDLPESVATVHPDHVANWGVPLHDLFQLGLRNVRAEGLLEAQRLDLGEGGWLNHYEDGANYFGSAHAMLLHDYFEPLPELGVLVSVPTRHGMVVHAIQDLEAVTSSFRAIMYFTHELYRRGPGSISPNVYWCRYGTFTLLPYEVGKDDTITCTPPASFCEHVLERIPAGPE